MSDQAAQHSAEFADTDIHWIGDAPTSLHGNGAASFAHTTSYEAVVTCRLCLSLLARNEHCLDGSGCDGRSHDLTCNNAYYAEVRREPSCSGCGHEAHLSRQCRSVGMCRCGL